MREPERIAEILRRLRQAYPDAQCALRHSNPLELLVATILSAQCTDERVNQVTLSLFQKYRSAEDYAMANPAELEQDIRPTGFYRNKARHIQGAARVILERFGGEVPQTMDELLQLPGVARKTANVVLGVAFGQAEGIVVDTHVRRLANRLGLTKEQDPDKIERDLMAIIPREHWIDFGHQLIWHGRCICHARKPDCPNCPLNDLCPSAQM
ncbi:MAG: endonuclease III [Anaerolineae bacterium]|nr:endonuclease III [Anaerolineae bacterium]MDW8099463.1 endonuclease III [Anaerolineae bacterium]